MDIYTIRDLAKEYGVSVRRAQAIAKDHGAKKISGIYLFDRVQIEAMRPGESGRPWPPKEKAPE